VQVTTDTRWIIPVILLIILLDWQHNITIEEEKGCVKSFGRLSEMTIANFIPFHVI
jgi:hypothetical protein